METKNIIIEAFKSNRVEFSAIILKEFNANSMPSITAPKFLAHCMEVLVNDENCAVFVDDMATMTYIANENERALNSIYGTCSEVAKAECMKFFSYGHCLEAQDDYARATGTGRYFRGNR